MAAAAEGVQRNPAALLALRAARPGMFACELTFEPLPVAAGGAARQAPQGDADARAVRQLAVGRDSPPPAQTHLLLVSQRTSVAQILWPCCEGVARRAQESWLRSHIRLPW